MSANDYREGFWDGAITFTVSMFVVIVVFVLVAGCAAMTPMDWHRPPPSDWPTLSERIVTVDAEKLKVHCAAIKYGSGRPVDCAFVNFAARTCTVYVLADLPQAIEHARGHCRGYDHPGESTMRDGWARWKGRG